MSSKATTGSAAGHEHSAQTRLRRAGQIRRLARLVDRIWPRGLKKRKAQIDEWLKVIAPSTALRKWFGHDPARWAEFRKRYAAELDKHSEEIEKLAQTLRNRRVTLLFGAKDTEHNNAVALKAYIEQLK